MSFNLNEEVIDGYLVTAETKKLWAVEMDLAKQLLDVCAKYNLKIWATGGTLIGAVRHKGFVPWDDDMDFCMMRDDFNKLVSIGPTEFHDPYFFQSFYTDCFWGGMIKLRQSDTAMIPSNWKLREYNMGIFIDVFVLDAIPDDELMFAKMYRKVKMKRKLLHNNNIVHPENLPLISKIKHSLISCYFKFISPENTHKNVVRLLSENSIEDNQECGLIDFSALEGHDINKITLRCNKHCYDETIDLPFHDMVIPAPKGYDELLRRQYGDYMTPVMGGQFHTNIIIDCNRSYKEVLAELKKEIEHD